MTSQGVNWLIQRWVELAEMLRRNKFWHYPEKFRAVWMLGKNPHDVFEDKLVQKIFLACNVAHPEVSDGDKEMLNLWDECYQAKMGIAGKPMYVLQLDNIRGFRPPDALTAQAQLWEIITGELNRLAELKKNASTRSTSSTATRREERAMFDGSKEGVLLRRYRDGVRARVPQGDRGPHEAPQGGRFEARTGARRKPLYRTKPSPKSMPRKRLRRTTRFRPGSRRSRQGRPRRVTAFRRRPAHFGARRPVPVTV